MVAARLARLYLGAGSGSHRGRGAPAGPSSNPSHEIPHLQTMSATSPPTIHPDADLRFAFGRNWKSFLSTLDERRIEEARLRLCEAIGRTELRGLRVLDIGSGSGLSSLVMYRLGAEVVSFDYDPDSVACTEILRKQQAPEGGPWTVLHGSVLDAQFMESLGQFDLVYSWGVLHHTGAMWQAVDLASRRTSAGGTLLLALYNDQGWRSQAWRRVKRFYCSSMAGRWLVGCAFYPLFALYSVVQDIGLGQLPGAHARQYRQRRGMSLVHDWRDWLGGYPFEVAKPAEVVRRLAGAGFKMQRQSLAGGLGCNEWVFTRLA